MVGKILTAIFAEPVFDVALTLCRGGRAFKTLKAGMINGIYLTVFAAADFANGLGGAGGLSALMGTGISALFALAVFPFVVFLGDRNRAAAIPLLRMGLFIGAPDLFEIGRAHV